MKKSNTSTELVELQKSHTNRTSLWTREKISHLIKQYKKHECLWNYWHEDYKSRDKRRRAIENICQTLSMEKFDVGKKIHNLRNQFNTEKKKLEQRIEESGANINDKNIAEFRGKWSHFESLMFLRDVIEPRPGYPNAFQPPKKMRFKFDSNSSVDEINASTILSSSCGSNTGNLEDLSRFQSEENISEEVITDDYQSMENEILEIDQSSRNEEACDKKYQPPQQQEQSSLCSSSFSKSSENKKRSVTPQTTSACSSQNDTNTDDSSVKEHSENKITFVPSHSHIITTSSSASAVASPIISSVTSSNSSNRPASILRDQWDAFGELVANEFRNLNSEISRKLLKRKIMQAMLEVGEKDDHLTTNLSRSN